MESFTNVKKEKEVNKSSSDVKAHPIAWGKGYAITIFEGRNGFWLRIRRGKEKINLQLDLLRFLEVAQKIKERVSKIAK